MKRTPLALALALAFPLRAVAHEPSPDEVQTKSLGVVTVNSGQPTSLPTQIPTTIEGVTHEQIEATVNATDSEDAIKYFPSLLVRKRYIGDYNHAVLSSRASGTGNSARSAVYADGILLSNYLGNGATYAPRWGLVTPEEIERVDVMYGPFSAAYPGNSVGAVVDYVTRMPTQFEGHAKLSAFTQNFSMYNTSETYNGSQASASLGSKNGDRSWWTNINHTDSAGQPLVFATKPISTTAPGANPTATGAVWGLDKTNTPWYILGTTTQYHTVQDHAKIKLAYDISSTLRASYVLGNWNNKSDGSPQTYLRDSSGASVYGGTYAINGNSYALNGLFSATKENLDHWMHGLSVKSNTRGEWDWEVAASRYDYATDLARSATINSAANLSGAMGSSNTATITDQKGTGWTTLATKGVWRPQGMQGAHIADFGVQQDNYQMRIYKTNISSTGNWITDGAASFNSDVGGKTQLQSVYGQDAWAFAPKWKTVLGARVENWTASGGYARSSTLTTNYDSRNETYVSPKGALAYQWSGDIVLKGSVGRAVRMPTVQELYGATSTYSSVFVNDPNLRPEKSWTTELSVEKDLGNGLLRLTVFNEDVTDSLYSQTISGSTPATTSVQNVDAINTKGIELAYQGVDVIQKGLDVSGSITYADSRIVANSSYVATPGDTIGKYQPRVPVWRATVLANCRFDDQLSASLGVRYSGDQYSTLNNADVNGFAYTAASRYLVVDVRTRYRIDKHLVAAFGIDNLSNEEYWNYHPYPKRTYLAELKYDF
jgi:iron complex outermembrane receptor protein